MKTGIELITEERQEQIEKHGRTIESDVKYNSNYELSHGATALMFTPDEESPVDIIVAFGKLKNWDAQILNKMVGKPYKERLVIAGALIAAEIDRLQNKNIGEFSDKKLIENERCSCGVPNSQHNTCCGWENANIIFFPWEHTVPAYISPEEKEVRWLLSQQPNGIQLATKIFPALNPIKP